MRILLSNDDGIYSANLRSLYAALLAAGHEVRVVAPDMERSGAGCSITNQNPLQVREIHEPDFDGYALNGTPADCVQMGMNGLFDESYTPDVVMSGINRGANAGYDVLYSGTVGAALQAALVGVPAVAVSSCLLSSANREQAGMAVSWMERLDFAGAPRGLVYNFNFPDAEPSRIKGLKVCPLGRDRGGFGRYGERRSPSGRPYWWISDLDRRGLDESPGTDRGWLRQGYATLTPLRFDVNDYPAMDNLRYLEK